MGPERYENHPKRTGKNKADNGSGWLKPKKRYAIYERDEWKCIYCLSPMSVLTSDYVLKHGIVEAISAFTVDHLVPTELGGTNAARNLVTACKSCNSSKGKKSTKNFLQWLWEKKGIDPEEIKARIRRQTRRKLKNFKERPNGKCKNDH